MSTTPDPWLGTAALVAATATPDLHKWRRQLVQTIRLTKASKERHQLSGPGWDDFCGRPLLGLVEIQLLLRNEPLPPL